jgi:hypothetical protein
MILDAQNLFSDEQAITVTAASSNIIDLGVERRIGTGEPLHVDVLLDEAMTDAGSDSTITVTLESDDNSGFASPAVVATIGTFAALSAAGTRKLLIIPPDVSTERFIRLNYTVANGALTTGKVTAFVALGIDAYRSYADNITIS